MADPNAVAAQIHENLITARTVIDAHGTSERKQRIAFAYPDVPLPSRDAVRFQAYTAELLAGLAEVVRGIKTAA